MIPKRAQNAATFSSNSANLKSSVYDWDSPSSYTGTVKRRPSLASQELSGAGHTPQNLQKQNNRQPNQRKGVFGNHIPPQEISSGNCPAVDGKTKNGCQHILQQPKRSESPFKLKGKHSRLRMPKPAIDADANKLARGPLKSSAVLQKLEASHQKVHVLHLSATSNQKPPHELQRPDNSSSSSPSQTKHNYSTKVVELFRDFPSSCESNTIIENLQMGLKPLPPPYRDPPEPPPLPSVDQIPSLNPAKESVSPGKQQQRFGSKQQGKGLIKSTQEGVDLKGSLLCIQQAQSQSSSHTTDSRIPESVIKPISVASSDISCKQKGLYKGRVSELKSCISRINSRGLFSLSGTSKQSQDNASEKDETLQLTNLNDYILHNPSSKTTMATDDDDILAKPEFSASLFKNIPVRPRKGGIPHLDNYYLFDPNVDFINEKNIKKNELHPNPDISPKSDNDVEEEPIEEIIYEDESFERENSYAVNQEKLDHDNCTSQQQSVSPCMDEVIRSLPCFPKSISDSLKKEIGERYGQSGPVSLNRQTKTITADSSSLVRRKTLLNLAPFCTNSLRLSRYGTCASKQDLRYRNRTIPIESNYVLFNPGPVPNRSIQYKIRKSRPLSTHSDADSGFLSPCSPDEPKFNPAVLVLEQCDSIQGYIEIYTDWANYYLDRAKSKKKVADLSADCRDGILLADVIEAVTSFKVPDLIKKPKSQQQMLDNVNSCLLALRSHSVGGLETVTASDICTGRLKAVLALFFALSRFKQQAKQQKISTGSPAKSSQPSQQQQPLQQPENDAMVNRQIPVSYSKTNGGTAIPLPATVLVQRRCPPDKIRPLPPTPNHTPSIPGLAKTGSSEVSSSRPGSPPSSNSNLTQSPKGNNNGLRQLQCKIPATGFAAQTGMQLVKEQHQPLPQQLQPQSLAHTANATSTKHSMLEKLKLFNKEKSSTNSSSAKSQVSKRTSSSSGFSSARSERSDSSLSLNDGHVSQIKPPSVSASTAVRIKDQSAKNVKHSKLFGGPQKTTAKETPTLKSSLKKEKSPARKETEIQAGDSKLSQLSIKNQKSASAVKVDAKSKMSSRLSSSKLDVRTEVKHNLTSSNKPMMTNASTGIPKPMAAIKGTSKTIPALEKKPEVPELKADKNDISNSNQDIISSSGNMGDNRMHIVNPLSMVDAIQNGPMFHTNKLLQNPSISMSDSLHSSSTQSGGGLHSNSSESSVIYRPSSESGSDLHYNARMTPPKNVIPNRKLDFEDQFSDGRRSNGDNSSTAKFHTVPSKIVGTIYEEEKPVNVLPMRPLLRGYNSHVTLPTRGARGQHYVNDFCESDVGQGYCSDGDALRRTPASRLIDVDNGYMSEGGGEGNHGKHFLSLMRARSQLPTTIEERIRCSRGSLDSLSTSPLCGGFESGSKMELNNSSNRSSSSTRNGVGRDSWSKMPEPHNGHGQPSSPTSGRKEKYSPSHSRRNVSSSSGSSSSKQSASTSGRTKGVPQSFGYVKRSNGSATGNITTTDQQNVLLMGQQQGSGRTAHVSAVPRSGKIKVSGGTQTCTSDLQTKIPPNTQHRSFSLTGPGATQLSQSIRERLSTGSHSLPKPGTDVHLFQHRVSNRGSGKILDGSLSDTQTYAEVKPEYSTYAMWLKHSNTASSRLSEGDSLESLQIGSPGMTRHGHKIIHRGESSYIQSPRLNRSNSIRSTKSEKMYPSMLSRGPDVEIEPYYCLPVGTLPPGSNGNTVTVPWSQPTSPTPPNRGFGGPLSPTHAGSANITGCLRLAFPKKNDEVHGSAASLLSGGSSLYGSAEERQANEVRRLKRELTDAREQVMSLYSQLSTNAHVVAAFEQSLSNMTQRLQQLTATAERKDSELTDMRQTIELLRKQSIQAGLTTAHMQSMGVQTCSADPLNKQQLAAMKAQPPPPSTTTTNGGSEIQRHHSSDSMCSLNSVSSGCSAQDKKKKKGWLRSSFTKAFSRNAKISKTSRHVGSTSSSLDQNSSIPTCFNEANSSLPPPSPTKSPQKTVPIIENAKPVDSIDLEGNPVVEDLKKQLREKDLVLTDIRLEALSSASQLESLKDTVMKMRAEMISLKQNNERLQKLVTSRSLAGSEVSLGNAVSPNGSIGESRRYSIADSCSRPPMELPKSLEEEAEDENIPPAPAPEPPPPPLSPPTHIDLTPPPPAIEAPSPTHLAPAVEDVPDSTDGKKIAIAVYLGQPDSFAKYAEEILESDNYYSSVKSSRDENEHENGFEDRNMKPFPNPALNEFVIAYTYISGKTTWQNLDYIVRKTFKDYASRIDPGTNLGLNTDSITSYHLGEAKRGPEMGFPELLPCGYIVGSVKTLYICLQGVGSLTFDSLIPRSIVHRYISLLTEHRRLILCGPSGTGKSYLARKLAEFLVARSGRGNPSEAIATFNVDHKSSKELRQYLGHIAEQASIANGVSELPSVIILDNLHHASALGDVFSCLLSAGPAAKLPCIIGTMSQATCNTTNLQLHHNFRWVLTANHMEPVKGFLGRFLRRRLFSLELSTQNCQPELSSVLAWLPTVWQHINRFLENHSSSDVTIGPRLFLSCPLDLKDSQVWFTDVWNYHLAPYLMEAVREGVQLYGRRGGAWNDPSTFIRDTYPWSYGPDSVPPLRQINAEDVGLEAGAPGNSDSQDPLLNMLMRLQEAANYSGNQEQESDCASLDSNITPDSSAGAE